MRFKHPLVLLPMMAVAVVIGLTGLASAPVSRGQPAPTPSVPPAVLFPAALEVPAGSTIVFHDAPPLLPTAAPGRPPPTANPAGCGRCERSLSVRDDASADARVAFDGTTLTISMSADVVLQLFVTRVPIGITGLSGCAMGRRQNQLSCEVQLGPPFPSLDLAINAVPSADADNQTITLPTARGQTLAVLAAAPTTAAQASGEQAVPMLEVTAGNLPVALQWDETALTITAPPGLSPQLRSRASQEALSCDRSGDRVDAVVCSVDTEQSPDVEVEVRLPAGWNIVGAPDYTAPPDSSPLYTLPPGAPDYVMVTPGASLQDGVGYWVYNATPAVPRPIATGAPVTVHRAVSPGQFAMIGNARQVPVCVRGASVVYVYDPVAGYVEAAVLQPGQGAWAVSDTGALSLDAYPATPCP